MRGEGALVAIAADCGVGSLGLAAPFPLSFFPALDDGSAILEAAARFGPEAFLGGFDSGTSTEFVAGGWDGGPSEREVEEQAGSSIAAGVEADKAEFQRWSFSLCCRALRAALVNAWQ